ncbi:MAG: ribonuclease III [Lachnospiraceae bacterium]|nr:ribonuclease III [Lachnospiraceae bacterium]
MEIISFHKDNSILEKKIGYEFKNKDLLITALTHSSFANEHNGSKNINGRHKDYERLEFLGDAVLEMISSDYLFHRNPDMPEGKLTKLRASMVCEPALARCARDLGLEQFILLGKGEENTGGRERDSIISDVMEALIGAVYLDGGIEHAKTVIFEHVLDDLNGNEIFKDSKTLLQEIIQSSPFDTFEYRMAGEEGPDHAKVFMAEAVLDGKVIGAGKGRTKKAAEQMAAAEAIDRLKGKK